MSPTDEKTSSGADKPEDLLEGFASAATKWSSAPMPDTNVSTAFSLGWRVAQAIAWAHGNEPPEADRELPRKMRWAVLIGQIQTAQDDLAKETSPSAPPATDDLNAVGAREPEDTASDMERLHDRLLQELYVRSATLGKAFRLGRDIHRMCAGHSLGGRVVPALDALSEHGSTVRLLLGDLASKFPANAAHSVMNSLSLWEKALDPAEPKRRRWLWRAQPPAPRKSNEEIVRSFRTQGGVWYSMLAGEVAARDLLRLSDYVGCAEEVVGRLRELAVRAVRGRLWPWVVLVMALLVAGVLVLVLSTSASGVTVGATSLIAALGLTWKGIGEFFGRAAAKGEQALWDAQLDWTIAYRCTISIDEPSDSEDKRAERLQEHVQTWRAWQRRWPDLDDQLPAPRAATRTRA